MPNLILNMREGSCGCDVQQCPVSALSSGSPVGWGWWVGGGGEQLCCLPGHQPRTKKWQAFNGSFWRWLLYYSGSANLTWPNEDLAPRHLLVSNFIMSSSPVHACPGIMGVCLSESPGQRRNIDWTTFWKYCLVRPKHISGHSVLFLKISDYSSFLLFFFLLKTKKKMYPVHQVNVKNLPFGFWPHASRQFCSLPKYKPNEECLMIFWSLLAILKRCRQDTPWRKLCSLSWFDVDY